MQHCQENEAPLNKEFNETELLNETDVVAEGVIQLEQLLPKGVTIREIQLLRGSGFHSVESVAYSLVKNLTRVKGISEEKAHKLKTLAQQEVGMGFCSGVDYHQMRSNIIKLTSGSTKVDQILKGGFETGSITELYGEFRTGKTQLCHTLAVTAQLSVDEGGGAGKVLWIDTENTFRPERVVAIAQRFDMDPEAVLQNIAFARAHNSDHQSELLTMAAALMSASRYALLIVDSITHLYRSDYSGRGELAARQQHMMQFLRNVQKIADIYGIAVVMTNQVMAKVDPMPGGFGPDKVPVGGHVLAHASQHRMFLKKCRGDTRSIRIMDSPNLAEGEANFSITDGGVADVVDS